MARRLLGSIVLVAALAGCEAVDRSGAFGKRDYSIDPSAKFQKISLSDLMGAPTSVLDVDITGVFRQRNELVWQPFYTPFTPDDYASFSLWPTNARLWEVQGRAGYCPTFFIDKDHSPFLKTYHALAKYEVVRVRGTVRSDFQNRPWINVIYLERAGSAVYTDDAISHLVAGIADTDGKRYAGGIAHLQRALDGGGLPDEALAVAHFKMGWCHEARARAAKSQEDWSQAVSHYRSAVGYDPGHRAAASSLLRAEHAYDMVNDGLEVKEPMPEMEMPVSYRGADAPVTTTEQGKTTSKADAEAMAASKAKMDAAMKTAEEARLASEARASEAALRAESLAAELADLRSKMAAGSDATKMLDDKVKQMEAAMAEQMAKVQAAENAAAEANAAKTKVEAELAEVKNLVASGGDATKMLDEKVKQLEASLAAESAKVQLAETAAADANNAKAKAELELAELRKTAASGGDAAKMLEEKVRQVEAALAAETAKVDEAQKAAAAANEAKTKVEAELADAKKAHEGCGDAGGKMKELEGQVAGLTAELADAKKAHEGCGDAAGKMKELEGQVAALTAERDELARKLAEAPAGGGDTEALKKQIEEKDKALAAREAELRALAEAKDAQAVSLRNIREQNDALEEENAKLTTEKTELGTKVSDLEKQVEELKKQLETK